MDCFLKRISIAGLCVYLCLLFVGGQATHANELETLPEHWIWPTDGVVTDTYGTRHGHHHGIDIAGEYGAPIYAVDAGVVTKSYYSGSYGHVVFIKHENNLETVYAHLSSRQVEEGQTVNQGDIIGKMGSTGRSSGVHLHFEVHEIEWTINKENSINPSHVLGDIHIGESVEVMMNGAEEAVGLVNKVAMAASYSEVNYMLYSDFQLLKEGLGQTEEESVQVVVTADMLEDQTEVSVEAMPAPVQKEIVHVVEKGDTLWDIAETYETSVYAIMQTNRLRNETIHPSQQLLINKQAPGEYIVKPGDTLLSISRVTNVPVEKLKELNRLRSDLIYPQQILMVDG